MIKKFLCKTIKIDLLMTVICINLLSISICFAASMEIQDIELHHLFMYKKDQILDYIKAKGYSKFTLDKIDRNSTGTTLNLHNFYRQDKQQTIILSISKGGIINKIIPPAKFAYLNDTGEPVLWFDDIKKSVHFKNGLISSLPLNSRIDVDPSGKFFFVAKNSSLTEIFSIDRPDIIIGFSKFKAEKIFIKDNDIYLFARNYQNIKSQGDYEQHEIICQIFKKAGLKYELSEEIYIPRLSPRSSPFAVIDMDPWSYYVLIVDVRDVPFSFLTTWYLFDLKTKKMIKIGRAKGYAFFLEKDVLEMK
jgi:hypothetical protein